MLRKIPIVVAFSSLVILGDWCWGGRGDPVITTAQQVSATEPGRGASHRTTPVLEGMRWRLIELGGAPVTTGEEASEADLVLNADGKKLAGSSGCNRLVGGYTLRRRSLHFTPVGLTRMACPEPLMKQEQAFVEALKATTSYHIVSDRLELRDRERVLARFERSIEGSPSAKPTTAPTAASLPSDKWLGQWNGPEGTYLLLSKKDDTYVVKIRSLDGLKTYAGTSAGDVIRFTRDSKIESIHAGNGKETGMKWLLDKKNCLIIKTGEGFCRN